MARKIDKGAISKRDLKYFDNHDFGKEMSEGLKDGSTIVFEGSWKDTVKAIKARKAKEATKMASFRLPVVVIDGLKKKAAMGGVKYSEYVIETLSKAAV